MNGASDRFCSGCYQKVITTPTVTLLQLCTLRINTKCDATQTLEKSRETELSSSGVHNYRICRLNKIFLIALQEVADFLHRKNGGIAITLYTVYLRCSFDLL